MEMCSCKSQLALVLLLIGSERGARFANQSTERCEENYQSNHNLLFKTQLKNEKQSRKQNKQTHCIFFLLSNTAPEILGLCNELHRVADLRVCFGVRVSCLCLQVTLQS